MFSPIIVVYSIHHYYITCTGGGVLKQENGVVGTWYNFGDIDLKSFIISIFTTYLHRLQQTMYKLFIFTRYLFVVIGHFLCADRAGESERAQRQSRMR